jgi:DNA uptake protein ComE-like DNA-binding protein
MSLSQGKLVMSIKKIIPLLLALVALAPLPAMAQSTPSNTMTPPADTMSPPQPTKKGSTKKKSGGMKAGAKSPSPSSKSTTVVVNVNTDASADLQKVKGIGEATAKKIIAGRPYATLDDLVTKKVMSASQLAKFKPQLTVK